MCVILAECIQHVCIRGGRGGDQLVFQRTTMSKVDVLVAGSALPAAQQLPWAVHDSRD